MAFYDCLTELPNRAMFRNTLIAEIKTASRYDEKVSVFYLDLDGFKQVNDTLGHLAGGYCVSRDSKEAERVCER